MSAKLAQQPAKDSVTPIISEIIHLADSLQGHVRQSCADALRIGLRLLSIHQDTGDTDAPGGFRAALATMEGHAIPPATAYRWLNAAAAAIVRIQHLSDPSELIIPAPGTLPFEALDHQLEKLARGMSIRRLLIGSSATSDESRMDTLITAAETGDPSADAILDAVAKGKITLVQAIRAHAGQTATKGKTRHDPIYLDIDGTTGQPTGLVPKCLVTLARAFAQWPSLDETARIAVKSSWKALIANLPSDLRR